MARGIPLNWFLIGGIGLLYLLYARKSSLPPFNSGGLAETYLPDFFGPGRGLNTTPSAAPSGPNIPMGAGGGGVSLPPPLDPARMTPQQMMAGRDIYGNPVKPGTNPFEAPMAPGMIDLGSGYQMANPNGTPNSFGSGASRATQFQSTVANDPTPTDYGIYTQYLNGLRNEYLQMEEQRRVANAQDIGIGGDITTLPAPPVVGATPFNYPGPRGMGPPPMMGPGGGQPMPPYLMGVSGGGGVTIGLGGPQLGGTPAMHIGAQGQIGYGQVPGQPRGYTNNPYGSMHPGMSSGFPQAYPGQFNYPPPYAQGPILYPPGGGGYRSYATKRVRHPHKRNKIFRIERLEDRINRWRDNIEDKIDRWDDKDRDRREDIIDRWEDRWDDRIDRFRERAEAYPATFDGRTFPGNHPFKGQGGPWFTGTPRVPNPHPHQNWLAKIDRIEDRFGTEIAGNKQSQIDRMRERMSQIPANTASVLYDEGANGGPADLTGIKPTLFNMVSRNQPGGLKGQRVGNVS